MHRVLAERYRLDERGWARLLTRLETVGNRGAIVGPHGSGKTTLLEDLGVRLERAGRRIVMLRFDASDRRLGACDGYDERDFVLVDGAEQLNSVDWLRLRWRARSARGFVITSHRGDMLPLLHRCETSPELLRGLVASLGESLSVEEGAELFQRHAGNLRDAVRELYDRCEERAPAMS